MTILSHVISRRWNLSHMHRKKQTTLYLISHKGAQTPLQYIVCSNITCQDKYVQFKEYQRQKEEDFHIYYWKTRILNQGF